MLDLSAVGAILDAYGRDREPVVPAMEIGGRRFDFTARRYLMGVINLSPDSWYSESVCTTEAAAIERGLSLQRAGADFVDIGAESTLADARKVPSAEQSARLLPVVRRLSAEGVLVSVESYWPEVLEAAAEAGARVFNLTGVREDREAFRLARRFEAAVVLCYVQGETVRDVVDYTFADDMTAEMERHFRARTALAAAQGVTRCILDPGLGFYYANLQDGRLRINHQMRTFLNTFRLARLGFPTLNILPHAPEIFGAEHRRAAEPFFAVLALLGGTHILRTHELPAVARVRQVMEAYRTS
jgi:dihydropteroate synthase